MKPIDGIPKGYELIDSDGVYYSPIHHEIVITGTPGEEDERHNCDHMGCSSIGHVIFRAKVSSLSYSPLVIKPEPFVYKGEDRV